MSVALTLNDRDWLFKHLGLWDKIIFSDDRVNPAPIGKLYLTVPPFGKLEVSYLIWDNTCIIFHADMPADEDRNHVVREIGHLAEFNTRNQLFSLIYVELAAAAREFADTNQMTKEDDNDCQDANDSRSSGGD